jgi:hypothetical protein
MNGGGEMGTPDRREGGKNYSLLQISKIQKELHTRPPSDAKKELHIHENRRN